MSSSMTFPQFLDNIHSIYQEFKELPTQREKFNPDGLIKKTMTKISNFFSDQTDLNQPISTEDYNITPQEFIKKCIGILEPYLEKNMSGVSKHDLWETNSFKKISELKKINSYTNEKKHIELIKLLQGKKKKISKEEYFKSFLNKEKSDDEEEKMTDIDEYKRIVQIMASKGMPLSLNEKINVLESKIGYWQGILNSLQEKKKE